MGWRPTLPFPTSMVTGHCPRIFDWKTFTVKQFQWISETLLVVEERRFASRVIGNRMYNILHQIPAAVKESLEIILSDEETTLETKILWSSYNFIYDAVAELTCKDRASWEWYHNNYYDWMEHIVALGTCGALTPVSSGCKM